MAAEFAQLVGRPSVTMDEVQSALRGAHRRVSELTPPGEAGAGTTLTGVVAQRLVRVLDPATKVAYTAIVLLAQAPPENAGDPSSFSPFSLFSASLAL